MGPASPKPRPSPWSLNHVAFGKGKLSLSGVHRLLQILSGFPPTPDALGLLESYSKAGPRCHLHCEACLGVPLLCQSESVNPFLMLPVLGLVGPRVPGGGGHVSHRTVCSLKTETVGAPMGPHGVLPRTMPVLARVSSASTWEVSPMHPNVRAERPGFPLPAMDRCRRWAYGGGTGANPSWLRQPCLHSLSSDTSQVFMHFLPWEPA